MEATSGDEEDVVTEEYVVLDFPYTAKQILNEKGFVRSVRLSDLSGPNPSARIKNMVYSLTWREPPGTMLLFTKQPAETQPTHVEPMDLSSLPLPGVAKMVLESSATGSPTSPFSSFSSSSTSTSTSTSTSSSTSSVSASECGEAPPSHEAQLVGKATRVLKGRLVSTTR